MRVWLEIAVTILHESLNYDGRWTEVPEWEHHKGIPVHSTPRMMSIDLPSCLAGCNTSPWKISPGPAP